MVKHIVMFEFLESAGGRSREENLVIAKERLDALVGVVPTLLSCQVHINDSQAAKSNYHLVLEAQCKDFEALSQYVNHPAHKEVVKFLTTVKSARACVDYVE